MTRQHKESGSTSRRTFLKSTGALAVAGAAAGCSGNGGDGSDGSDGGGSNDGGATTSDSLPTYENEAGVKVGKNIEAVQELATEEGAATVYATIDREPFSAWMEDFNEQYPDAKIEHVTGGNEKLGSRWESEYETDNVQGNLYIASTGIQRTWENNQVMELNPDILPAWENAPDKFKSDNGDWIATRQVLGNVFYNTDKVSGDEADTWMDVATNSDWQGQKIGWDPTPNMSLMSWLMDNAEDGFFDRLQDAEPRWVDSHTDLARLCGAGEFPVAFTYTHKMGRFGEDLPLDYFKFDPTPAQISPLVISNKAPQPNTTLLFANWLVSPEGQQSIGQTQYIPYHPEAEYSGYPGVYPSDEYEVDVISPGAPVEEAQQMWKEKMGDMT